LEKGLHHISSDLTTNKEKERVLLKGKGERRGRFILVGTEEEGLLVDEKGGKHLHPPYPGLTRPFLEDFGGGKGWGLHLAKIGERATLGSFPSPEKGDSAKKRG